MKSKFIAGLVGIVVVAGLGLGVLGTTKIPAGTAGIVYKANGGVSDNLLTQGWKWSMPILTKVSLYSTSIEQSYMSEGKKGDSKEDESFKLMTADGKEVKVDMEFSFRFDIERLPETFAYFKGRDGDDIKETFIKPKMVTVANNVSTQYNVFDIYGSLRPQLNADITTAAIEYFDQYGIIIDRVSITNVTPDESTKQAIQAKVDKLQELEIAKTNKEIAQQEAEKATIEAQGKADAAIVEAEGERKVNELKNTTLTDSILKQLWIEKWNGSLPQVSGDGVSPIVNMTKGE